MVCPSGVTTRSSIGRSGTVYTTGLKINRRQGKTTDQLSRFQTSPKNGKDQRRTIVSTHTPNSASQVRTVESNPQLYARLFEPGAKSALDTRAVWDLSTVVGALRFPRPWSASPAILRRFLRSEEEAKSNVGATSSWVGIVVSQRPIRWSQDAVRIWEPVWSDEMEVRGEVWRWSEARVWNDGEASGSSETRMREAVRSCEALATRTDSSVGVEDGTTQTSVMGA